MNTRRDLCDSDGSTIIPDLPAAQSDVLCAIRQNNMSSGPTPSKSYNTWENGVLGERVMVWVMSLQIKQKISGFLRTVVHLKYYHLCRSCVGITRQRCSSGHALGDLGTRLWGLI